MVSALTALLESKGRHEDVRDNTLTTLREATQQSR
jgi:hypothetical protein